MKNKNIFLAVLFVIVVGVVLLFQGIQSEKNLDVKSIHVIVKDHRNNEVLYDETVTTDVATLADWLQSDESLQAVGETGEYGYYLTSLLGASEGDGFYWVFESDNNKSCIESGFCPAADQVALQNQDKFTFKLTNVFE